MALKRIMVTVEKIQRWVRRNTQREIDVCDLPRGEYTLICSSEGQIFIGWIVYDQRSRVKDHRSKTWTVLSRRALPHRFSSDGNGSIKKVAA